MAKPLTEERALALGTGEVAHPNIKGYFTYGAMQVLVATGNYRVHQETANGYVLRVLKAAPEQVQP